MPPLWDLFQLILHSQAIVELHMADPFLLFQAGGCLHRARLWCSCCDASMGPTYIVRVVPGVENRDLAIEKCGPVPMRVDFAQTGSDDARWRHEASFLDRCHLRFHR